MKLVLRLAGFVDVARVPVAILGNALRAPMRPNAELRILVPLRRIVIEQRIPVGLEGAVSGQIGKGRVYWYVVPQTARDGRRRRVVGPDRRLPRRLVEFGLD